MYQRLRLFPVSVAVGFVLLALASWPTAPAPPSSRRIPSTARTNLLCTWQSPAPSPCQRSTRRTIALNCPFVKLHRRFVGSLEKKISSFINISNILLYFIQIFTNCNLIRWIEKANVRAKAVVYNPPGQSEQLIVGANVLYQYEQRTIGLIDNETAVQVLQKVKLALQDLIRAIGKLLRVSVVELTLDCKRNVIL